MSLVLFAPTYALAQHLDAVVTVEAEYGSFVWEGRVYTAAHHQAAGPYAGRHLIAGGRPSPCNDDQIPVVERGVVGVSHVDLDTFGGVLRTDAAARARLFSPDTQPFWDLAEGVDTRGPHRLRMLTEDEALQRRLRGFWAWSKGQPRLPRDTVVDLRAAVAEAGQVLEHLFADAADLLEAGDQLRDEEDAFNRASFVHAFGGVIVRHIEGNAFANHLYTTPSGNVMEGVVSWNRTTGAVTVSLADAVPGVSCREIVQALWGPEAGGHAGIAGSPRGLHYGFHEADRAAAALRAILSRREP